MQIKQLFKALAAAGCVSLALGAAQSSATAVIEFSTNGGANILTVADGSANDSCAAVGLVCFAGSFQNWDLTVNVGRSFSPNAALGIDLQFAALNNGNASNQIIIRFGDQNFQIGVGAHPITVAEQMSGTTDGSVRWQSGISSTNVLPFGGIDQIGALRGPAGPGAFSANTASTYNVNGAFSLLQAVEITESRTGLTTGDYRLKVPEPASLALLGLGLLAAGVASRRKRG